MKADVRIPVLAVTACFMLRKDVLLGNGVLMERVSERSTIMMDQLCPLIHIQDSYDRSYSIVD
jgi:hypothetical protein